MDTDTIISLNSPRLRYTGVEVANPHRATIVRGLNAVIGPNGAGKSTLGRIIEGGWNFMTNDISTPTGRRLTIRTIEFSDIHSMAAFKVEYYQQRFESSMNDEVPTVAALMADRIDTPVWRDMADRLGLGHIVTKRVNYLSSGELRKLLIVNMLFDLPDVLVIDNPYIGLDAASRRALNDTLRTLADTRLTLILLVSSPEDLPDSVSNVLPMLDMTLQPQITVGPADDIEAVRRSLSTMFDYGLDIDAIPLRAQPYPDDGHEIVRMVDCQVRYGSHVLLQGVNWTILQGQTWSLTGPNGSGKSTLLSLINADNPQGYANDISLFGRRRGSGESIWDIKGRIGYISPEMHLYFRAGNNTALEVIAGGLNDTPGSYRRMPRWQLDRGRRWLGLLGMQSLADRRYTTLSYGQQRLVLLARALVRDPELLILDEPLHGMDAGRRVVAREVIRHIVASNRCALIYVTHCPDEVPDCRHHLRLGQPDHR